MASGTARTCPSGARCSRIRHSTPLGARAPRQQRDICAGVLGGFGCAGRLSLMPRLQAGHDSRPAHRGTASRRYLRASSLQFSTTVALVSSAFVLSKTIPSEMRIWPLAVFSEFPESYSSPKASLFSSGPPDGLFMPKRNDKKTIYVGLAARRDRRFRGPTKYPGFSGSSNPKTRSGGPIPTTAWRVAEAWTGPHKNKLRIESERLCRICIVHGFDFEEGIAFVSLRSDWARCRLKPFAYADLAI